MVLTYIVCKLLNHVIMTKFAFVQADIGRDKTNWVV